MESSNLFGVVEATDPVRKLLKLIIQPYGTETGWCRTLVSGHLADSSIELNFPYYQGQEVLVAVVGVIMVIISMFVTGVIDQ